MSRAATEHFFLGETLLAPVFRRFDATDLGRSRSVSPTERVICAQDLLETILLRAAISAGADVRFSTSLVDLVQTDGGVIAGLDDVRSARRREVQARFVVAADGSRSAIRERLGITASGPGALGDSVSILVEAELADRVADRLSIIYKVACPHPSAAFAVVDNDRRWLLMMARDPVDQPASSFSAEYCLTLVRAALGDDDIPLRLLARRFFQPSVLVADRFRAGRVFLAGDAAHQATPFGALRMNCGIADAHNLAWKLAAVLHGWAGGALLDTYEEERRPVADATSRASILRADVSAGPPRAAFDGITMGYAYDSQVVVPDGVRQTMGPDPVHDYVPSAVPGHRAPHLWLHDGVRPYSVLDLFGDAFVLLTDRVVEPDLPELVRRATAAEPIPLRVHVVGLHGDLACRDEWARTYGVRSGGMVLVRPDGHVCWRAAERPADTGSTVGRVLQTAVGRTAHLRPG